jgi:hypothetical protein
MAQSNVYSLNVVGYVNITLKTGNNLISLPLQSADATSSISSVLTNTSPVVTPAGATATIWDPVHAQFGAESFANGDGTWADFIGNTAVAAMPPGAGFFFYLPTPTEQAFNGDPTPYITNLTVTVVGTVLQGTNSYPVTSGFGFYGNFEPVVQDLATNGWPVTSSDYYTAWAGTAYGAQLFGVSAADNDGINAVFIDYLGNPIACQPAVGQGFLYNRGVVGGATFTQVFTVK